MNLKKEKQIRRKAKQLMLDWLLTVVPDEEKKKVSMKNLHAYLPEQTHIYANRQLRISAYTLRWFIKRIKYLIKQGSKDFNSITVKDIEDV
tara:strand:- start:983 stop:1255 length:273 start_codon:yes stop_codon:yes gene_type:complete